ncbi:MAG: protein kinase [Victivallales bacterium]|nr:protein kinase [Victivallales bacterium]
MIPVPGSSFAGYDILVECGKGAYGTVFLGNDALGHRVAIKYMATAEAGDYELKGLRNYMALTARPSTLLQIHHCGFDDGRLFYVMEAADNAAAAPGEYRPDTLAERLRKTKRISASEALELGHALLEGLEVLHNAGMLHRDIKPENIIFVNGVPKLADPGLIRAVNQSISIAGTPGYLAPELLNGTKASPATDLYALGKVLYRAVTGNSPELYPEQPTDVPVDELYQLCRPLMRLCNSNPELRCQNCQQAYIALPKAIQQHGAIRRFRDHFVLRPAFRRQVITSFVQALALLILLLAMGFASRSLLTAKERFVISTRRLMDKEKAAWRTRLLQQLELLEREAPALDRQLNLLGEEAVQPKLDKARQLLTESDNLSAEHLLNECHQTLVEVSLRHLPVFDDNTPPDFQRVGKGWGYLASPLGGFLPSAQRQRLEEHLDLDSLAFGTLDSPHLGRTFEDLKSYVFRMAFIPPGSFHSPTTGSTQTIEYPYWMSTTEVSGALFSHLTKSSLQRSFPSQAAEYLTWNDALLFCHSLNTDFAGDHELPPGYAIRPPTEAEWEFVALDGWSSTPPTSREIPSHEPAPTTGSGSPNSFGVFNLDDNLAEMNMPYPEMPPKYAGALVARGADYRCDTTSVANRFDYFPDQGYRWGVGFRLVLAPTPPDYYSTHWYRGPEIRMAAIDGAIYAGFTTIQANLTWENAVQLAHDCGATLPDIDDLPKLPQIYRELGLVTDYPCHLAIHFHDDAWRGLEDNGRCEDPRLKPATDQRTCLDASATGLTPVIATMIAPIVLLKWDSQEAFDRRATTFLQHAAISSFELDGHRLAVCRAPITPYAIRTFAQFLGVKQPTLDYRPEVLTALLEHFPDEATCALGPIPFYSHWEQPDGTLFDFQAPKPEYNTLLTYHARLLCVLAAQNGRLVKAHGVDYFLVEI